MSKKSIPSDDVTLLSCLDTGNIVVARQLLDRNIGIRDIENIDFQKNL